jgi:hypothetical protein
MSKSQWGFSEVLCLKVGFLRMALVLVHSPLVDAAGFRATAAPPDTAQLAACFF